jgi:hypothetical protein
MANVKVPALLHKMSKAAQKAWYKKNNMEMPQERSAAGAKKIKPVEVKPVEAPEVPAVDRPKTAREISAERQAAYYAKGGRQPIGAGGSGGSSAMAGGGQSTIKDLKASIKAGFNPKVSLDPYESERAKKTGPRSLKMKKEEVQIGEALSPERKRMFDLKLKLIKKVANKKAYTKPSKVDSPRALLNPAADMKLNPRPPSGDGKEYYREEIQIDEVTKKEAESMLGGPVKTKPKMPPGKQPEGYRYVRALARRAMKTGLKKEESEQVDEGRLRRSMRGYAVLGGYGYGNKVRYQSAGERSREINVGLDDKQEKENARRAAEADKAKMKKEEVEQVDELKKSTLASYIGKAAGRLSASSRLQRDFEKDGHTEIAGEFQRQARKKRSGIEKAANKLAKEEIEQVDEVNARNSFVASQQALTPRAKDVKASVGTTRRDAAVTNKYARRISKLTSGAYSKQDVNGNLKSLAKEEAEQIDELKASTLGSYIAKSSADEKSRREKGVAVSKELSAKTGMKFGTPFDPKIHSKNASRSANRAVAIKKLTGQAKVNANEAAEGKVAVTPKEKSLAAHHGDKTKITFGDVLKARLKSAAAKKMGK